MKMKKDTTQNLKDLKCNNESTLVVVSLLKHPNIIQSHLDLQMERSELINMLSIILMSGKDMSDLEHSQRNHFHQVRRDKR